jgi:hypothetical protein
MSPIPLSAAPELATLLPRELLAELLTIARSGGAEFAEAYGEYTVQTSFLLDEERLKTSEYRVLQGVGIRAVRGEQTGYAYADGFAAADLPRPRVAARIARQGGTSARRVSRGRCAAPSRCSNPRRRARRGGRGAVPARPITPRARSAHSRGDGLARGCEQALRGRQQRWALPTTCSTCRA